MAAEEFVLGLAIGDPEVLKAAQFVQTSVGITGFFLILELVHVLEQQGFQGMSHFDIFLWVVETSRAVVITISGYLGMKFSSQTFLGCFCGISIVSSGVALLTSFSDMWHGAAVGFVVLRFFACLFYAMGGYFSFKLFQRAKMGDLIGCGGSNATDTQAYSLLGIPMIDMQVLKATQLVFTSLGIVVCLLGSFVIVGAEGALVHASLLPLWMFCVLVVLSMSYTAVAGVVNSNKALLSFFCIISGSLSGVFGIGTVTTMMTCGIHCLTTTIFDFFVVGVFSTAVHNAAILRKKLVEGVSLTATVQDQEEMRAVPAQRVGVGTPDEPPLSQVGVEEL